MSKDSVLLIFGAVLAVIGGIIGEYIKMRMQSSRERAFIKISLSDELAEISDIISKFGETFRKSGNANKSYINDLDNSMTSFTDHKNKLFLFKDQDTRRTISLLYKNMKSLINESEGKVGTLANTPESAAEQEKIVQNFQHLAEEATKLIKTLLPKKH